MENITVMIKIYEGQRGNLIEGGEGVSAMCEDVLLEIILEWIF